MNTVNNIKIWRKGLGRRSLALLLCLCSVLSLFSAFGSTAAEAAAEGAPAASSGWVDDWDTDPNGTGSRVFYNGNTSGSYGGVQKKNYIHVYAFAGETICLGTSVFNSVYNENWGKRTDLGKTDVRDEGTVDIVVEAPNGDKTAIDIQKGKEGHIATPALDKEAREMTSPDGGENYKPYTFVAKESGVYTISFHSAGDFTYAETKVHVTYNYYDDASKKMEKFDDDVLLNGTAEMDRTTNKDAGFYKACYTASYKSSAEATKATAHTTWFDTDFPSGTYVAAWNVTVFDGNEKKPGRTYADYLSLQMTPGGSGFVDGDSENPGKYQGVHERYFVLTPDSYLYELRFNDASPYTYNFFANNQGLLDDGTGYMYYKSVKDINNDNNFGRMGIKYTYPGTPDTDTVKGCMIFFEEPSDELEDILYKKAIQPDKASNVHFLGKLPDGKTGTYVGMGGTFSFEVGEATTSTLRLEFTLPLDTFKTGAEKPTYKAASEFDIEYTPEVNPTKVTFTHKTNKNLIYAYDIIREGGKDYIEMAPVELSTAVTPHAVNYVKWPGKDGNGVLIPEGTYQTDELVYSVTAKAGEIHFPIFDMESARSGITITRVSDIYGQNGQKIENDIFEATRSVVYYDDTPIYYGEQGAVGGAYGEGDVDQFVGKAMTSDGIEPIRQYCKYDNMNNSGGEYLVRTANEPYVTANKLRIGDHSSLNNQIIYYGEGATKDQAVINYLDSKKYPVGKSVGGNTVTDYGIANYWTFLPGETASTSDKEPIKILDGEAFNLTGRVFYDERINNVTNGLYRPQEDTGDHPLPGVNVNLYKHSADLTDEEQEAGYTYFTYDSAAKRFTEAGDGVISGENVYALIGTAVTDASGNYTFSGLNYKKEAGTRFITQVVKPDPTYTVTSAGKSGAPIWQAANRYSGNYMTYAYDGNATGAEIQAITVGGSDGVDPTKRASAKFRKEKEDANEKDIEWNNTTRTVTNIDVGYNYAKMSTPLKVSKNWDVPEGVAAPSNVVLELSYWMKNSIETRVYQEDSLATINQTSRTYNYLPGVTAEKEKIDEYFVSAEYYIYNGSIFRYTFEYDPRTGEYVTFLGKGSQLDLEALKEEYPEWAAASSLEEFTSFNELPDADGDTQSNATDLIELTKSEHADLWKSADSTTMGFTGTLNRFISPSETEITVTNSTMSGTIEVYKYSGAKGTSEAKLQGATFRLWELKDSFNEEFTDANIAAKLQPGSAEQVKDPLSTRQNGRVLFSGLDPTKTYILEEMYPPAGYQIIQKYYLVRPKGQEKVGDAGKEYQYNFGNIGDGENACLVEAQNKQSGDGLKVRKAITGRAWLTGESYDILISDVKYSDPPELESISAGGDPETLAKTFAENFGTDGPKGTVHIAAANEKYVDRTNTRPTVSSDERISGQLLRTCTVTIDEDAGTSTTDHDHKDDGAALNGEAFPAAGIYTIRLSEKYPAAEDRVAAMTYSPWVYEVTIQVTRVNEAGEISTDAEGTHLEASISQVTLWTREVDEATGEPSKGPDEEPDVKIPFSQAYPVFNNTYTVAPASQETGYAVVKNFTGRTGLNDNVWLDPEKDESGAYTGGDHFAFTVKGADETTTAALKSGDLVIGAFPPEEEPGVDNKDTFEIEMDKNTQDKEGVMHSFRFESLDFKNVQFPVEYTLKPLDPSLGSETKTVKDSEYTKEAYPEDKWEVIGTQTLPAEYRLSITENVPGDAVGGVKEGITYDRREYILKITLKNVDDGLAAANLDAVDSQEDDGIIEEMIFEIYKKKDATGSEITDWETQAPLSRCITEQHALGKDDEANKAKWETDGDLAEGWTDENGWSYYHDPDNPDITFRKKSTHDVDAAGKPQSKPGEAGFQLHHNFTFTNTYSAAPAEWEPEIIKELTGRDWLPGDEFTFRMLVSSADGEGFEIADGESFKIDDTSDDVDNGRQITIKGSDTDAGTGAKRTRRFPEITFTKAGTYELVLWETEPRGDGMTYTGDGISVAELVYTVTVTDDNKGQLVAKVSPQGSSDSMDTSAVRPKFVNVFSATGEFNLAILKTLEGKEWDHDTFTFTVTPDEAMKKAIDDETIVMPTDTLKQEDDGTYTGTLNGKTAAQNPIIPNGRSQSLGSIQFSYDPDFSSDDGETYTFTVAEKDPGSETHLSVFPKRTTVTVTVKNPASEGTGLPSGTLDVMASYAYDGKNGDSVKSEPGNALVLPFTNTVVNTRGVTISKTVQADSYKGTTDADELAFRFQLQAVANGRELVTNTVWTGEITKGTEKVSDLKAAFDAAGQVTYTQNGKTDCKYFVLKDGETLTLDEVPDGVTLTVTEIVDETGSALTHEPGEGEDTFFRPIGGPSKTTDEIKAAGGPYSIAFTNVYAPVEVSSPGDDGASLKLEKRMEGRPFDEDDFFTFTMTGTATDPNGEVIDCVMPDGAVDDGAEPKSKKISVTLAGSEYLPDDGTILHVLTAEESVQVDLWGEKMDADSKSIGWFPLTYTRPGTYTYTIKEEDGHLAGVTYSTQEHKFRVVVAEDEDSGKLTARVEYVNGVNYEAVGPDTLLSFTNTYTASSTRFTLTGEKTLTGRVLKDDEFEFTLTPMGWREHDAAGDGALTFDGGEPIWDDSWETPIPKPNDDSGEPWESIELSVKADGTIVFGDTAETAPAEGVLTFDYDDLQSTEARSTGRDFLYKIEETPSVEKGMTNDPFTTRYVLIHVHTADVDGVQEVRANVLHAYKTDGVTAVEETDARGKTQYKAAFTNTYKAKGTCQLQLEKVMDGRNFQAGDSFTFRVTGDVLVKGPAEEHAVPMPNSEPGDRYEYRFTPDETVYGQNSKTFSLDPITYDERDIGYTYEYFIREVRPSSNALAGVTYSSLLWEVRVAVTDKGNGELETEVTYINPEAASADKASFTNQYTAQSAVFRFNVDKTLTGRDLEAGEFTFKLEPVGWRTHDNGTASFDPDHISDMFGETNGIPMPTGAAEDGTKSVSIGADGEASFGGVIFDRDDTAASDAGPTERANGRDYLYKINEVNDNKGGVTYDADSERYVVVHVYATSDAADNVEIKAELLFSWSEAKGFTSGGKPAETSFTARFENAYAAKTNAEIRVRKTLTGRTLQEGDAFQFKIEGTSVGVVEAAPMPAKDEHFDPASGVYTLTVPAGDEAIGESSVDFAFPAIPFDQDDAGRLYRYTITEEVGSIPGMSYSGDIWTVNVTVTDQGNGTLKTDIQYDAPRVIENFDETTGPVQFINEYSAEPGSFTFDVKKTLTGRAINEDDKFTFELEPVGWRVHSDDPISAIDPSGFAGSVGDVPMPGEKGVSVSAEADIDGSAAFGSVTFDRDDTADPDADSTARAQGRDYLYKITETKGERAGVGYDETVHYAVVHVYAVDDGGVKIRAELIAWSVDGEAKTPDTGKEAPTGYTARFTNEYTAMGSDNITIKKIMDGRNFQTGDKFTFRVTGRVIGDAPKGHEVPMPAGGDKAEEEPDAQDYTIEPKIGNNTDTLSLELNYTQDDIGYTYEYFIREIRPESDALPGVTYSILLWEVRVTVTDNGDGTLGTEVTYVNPTAGPEEEAATEAAFTNQYTAESAVFRFNVDKTLTGRDIENREFQFTLTPVGWREHDGNTTVGEGDYYYPEQVPMPGRLGTTGPAPAAAAVDQNGNASFGGVIFDRDDTADASADAAVRATGRDYLYKITENNGGGTIDGVTYDGTAHYVVVHVYATSDAADNVEIKAERIAYQTDELHIEGAADGAKPTSYTARFANTYTAHAVPDVKIGVSKILEGRELLAADTFTFEIESIDGGPLPTENTDSYAYDGQRNVGVYTLTGTPGTGPWTFEFPAIPFNETHAGRTFRYAITEVPGAIHGMSYSTDRWTVNVTVTDNRDGTMKTDIKYDAPRVIEGFDETRGPAQFINEYSAKAGYFTFRVEKSMTGRALLDTDRFRFTLEGVGWRQHTDSYPFSGGTFSEDSLAGLGFTADGDIPLPEETAVSVMGSGSGGRAAFEAVAFDRDDAVRAGAVSTAGVDYLYKITETAGADGSIGYDETVHYVLLHVYAEAAGEADVQIRVDLQSCCTVAADGTVAKGTQTGSPYTAAFVNRYTAGADVTLSLRKDLEGRNFQQGDTFSFTLTPVTAGAPMPEDAADKYTRTIEYGDGVITPETADTVTFALGPIHYTQEDVGETYTYQLSEEPGDLPGVSYYIGAWTVTVKVLDQDHDGTLAYDVSYMAPTGGASGDIAVFTNTFMPVKPSVLLTKSLVTNGYSMPEDEYTFTFHIAPAADNPEPDPLQAGMDVPVTVSRDSYWLGQTDLFAEAAPYTREGEYTYSVTEQSFEKDGYKIATDETAHTVAFTVNEAADNSLVVEDITIDGSSPADRQFIVRNSYTPDDTSNYIRVEKTLYSERDLTGKEFTFELRGLHGAPMPEGAGNVLTEKVTVDVTGADHFGTASLSFGPIPFKEAGTYDYEVREIVPSVSTKEAIYDHSIWDVTVNVEDDGGKLKPTVTYARRDDQETASHDAAEFINFVPTKTEVSVKGAAVPAGTEVLPNADVSDEIVYTMDWRNVFLDRPVSDVSVTDSLDKGVDFVRAEILGADGQPSLTLSESDGDTAENAGEGLSINYNRMNREVTWELKGQPQGASGKVRLTVQVNAGASGLVQNDARVGVAEQYAATNRLSNTVTPGQLKVVKMVTGDEGEMDKDFTFTLTLQDADGNPASGKFAYTKYDEAGNDITPEGGANIATNETFTLRAGQYVLLKLPVGVRYGITESGGEGYGVTVQVQKPVEGALTDDAEAVVSGPAVNGTVHPSQGDVVPTVTFTNERNGVTGLALPIQIEKVLDVKDESGRVFKDTDHFRFILSGDKLEEDKTFTIDSGADGFVGTTDVTAAPGAWEVSIPGPGKYTYTVREATPANGTETDPVPGVTYSAQVYTLQLEAAYSTEDPGKLDVTYTVIGPDGAMTEQPLPILPEPEGGVTRTTLRFVNTYEQGEARFAFAAEKTLLPAGQTLTDGQFTFRLTAAGSRAHIEGADEGQFIADPGQPMPAGEIVTDDTGTYLTAQNNAAGAVTFGEAAFTSDMLTDPATGGLLPDGKDYCYTIEEVPGGEDYEYSTAKYPIILHVSADEDGNVICALEPSEYTANGYRATFVNTRKMNGALEIPVKKIMDNRTFEEDDRFAFTMTGKELNSDSGAPMPAGVEPGGVYTKIIEPGPENGSEFSFTLDAIQFTQADVGKTYVYTVKETRDETRPDIVYDAREMRVTVSVTAGAEEGTLSVTAVYQTGDHLEFVNEYQDAGSVVRFQGRKYISGRTWDATKDQTGYSFTLTAKDGAPMPDGAEGDTLTIRETSTRADENYTYYGLIDFGAIEYGTAGTYVYEITEGDDVAVPGVRKDDRTITATVTVTEEGDPAELKADVAYSVDGAPVVDDAGNQVKYFTFTNMYRKNLTIAKTVTPGDESVTVTDEDRAKLFDFTVALKDSLGAPLTDTYETVIMPDGTSGEIAAGSGRFQLHDGQYILIKELPEGTQYTVEEEQADGFVAVGSRRADGTLDEKPEVTFVNEKQSLYPARLTLSARKYLNDTTGSRTLQSGEFAFILEPVSTNPNGDPVASAQTLTNDGNGLIAVLSDALYSRTGTYEYRLWEDVSDLPGGIIPDNTIHTIAVTVYQETASAYTGRLMLTLTVDNIPVDVTPVVDPSGEYVYSAAPELLSFANTYDPNAVSVVLEAAKILKGDDLRDGMFSVILTSMGGLPAETALPDGEPIEAGAGDTGEPSDGEAMTPPEVYGEGGPGESGGDAVTPEGDSGVSGDSAPEAGGSAPEMNGSPDGEAMTPPEIYGDGGPGESSGGAVMPEGGSAPEADGSAPGEIPGTPSEEPGGAALAAAAGPDTGAVRALAAAVGPDTGAVQVLTAAVGPDSGADQAPAAPSADGVTGDSTNSGGETTGDGVPFDGGVTVPPAEGENAPPAEGENAPPVESENVPPVEGENVPPAEGETMPPVESENTPPVEELPGTDPAGGDASGGMDGMLPVSGPMDAESSPEPNGLLTVLSVDDCPMPGNALGPVTVTNVGSLFRFSPMIFRAEGTYNYQLREMASLGSGTAYDYTVYNIQVVVTRGEGDMLTAAVSYNTTSADDPYTAITGATSQVLTFTNATISKTSDKADKPVQIGDTIDYVITWANYAGETADVTVVDALDAGVELTYASGDYNYEDHVVTWTLPARTPGESGELKLTVQVQKEALDAWNYKSDDVTGVSGFGQDFIVHNRAAVRCETGVAPASVMGEGADGWKYTETIDNPVDAQVPGSLTVTKTVTGYGDKNRAFHFTVTLSDDSITGKYGDMYFDHGVAAFELTHGGSKMATGLTPEVTYAVEEAEANQDRYLTYSTGETGVIKANGSAMAVFVNSLTYAPVEPGNGDLILMKVITGSNADTTQRFHFTITLSDPNINGLYGVVDFANGVGRIDMGHGSIVTVSGLPAGTEYAVTEEPTPGYGVRSLGSSGTIPTNGSAAAVFFNEVGGTDEPTEPSPSPSATPEPSATPGPSASPDPGTMPQPDGRPHKVETAPGAGAEVTVGQWITYEIIWENYTGDAAAVTVRDPLDPGLSFVNAAGGTYDSASHTVTWSLGEQPAGARGSVTLTVSVNETARVSGAVQNMAYVKVGSDGEQSTETRMNPLPGAMATSTPPAAPGGPAGGDSPRTGDDTAILFWSAMLAVSLAGFGLVIAAWKRRKR